MGDLVLARDPVTMESGWKPVVRTSVSENREVLRLELVGADGKSDSLVVTPNHPFWGSEGTWRFASELHTGDIVLAASGWLLVKDTRGLAGGARVYNFEVADWHTYFVGDELAWVHNGGPACPVAASGAGKGTFPSNPAELMSDVPQTIKANGSRVIQPSETLRIRAEQHSLNPGETFSPRHHGQHYHIEMRLDPSKSWNNSSNVVKVKPPNYTPGEGTGFLPGEPFPGL